MEGVPRDRVGRGAPGMCRRLLGKQAAKPGPAVWPTGARGAHLRSLLPAAGLPTHLLQLPGGPGELVLQLAPFCVFQRQGLAQQWVLSADAQGVDAPAPHPCSTPAPSQRSSGASRPPFPRALNPSRHRFPQSTEWGPPMIPNL